MVNVRPSATAMESGKLAIKFVWKAVRTPHTWRHCQRNVVGSPPRGIRDGSLDEDGAQATKETVTQDETRIFRQVRQP